MNGGRWNQVNTAVVYTSIDENVAFSEYARRFRPRTLLYSTMTGYVQFHVPEGISVGEITEADLPASRGAQAATVVVTGVSLLTTRSAPSKPKARAQARDQSHLRSKTGRNFKPAVSG